MNKVLVILFLMLSCCTCWAKDEVHAGADRLELYLPLLKSQRVGVFANHTSIAKNAHLVDTLLKHHIQVVKIFAPEHGFRGEEDHKISNSFDDQTGIPVVSLYGKKYKPSEDDLKDVDILVFDIQDVGVRFYTYISSLQKFMEAAATYHKPLILLDRPNPNGFYVDGPILDLKYKSFTGMQPVPVVYGMTIGEYAKMLKGEQWLNLTPKSKAKDLQLTVIPCQHYTHNTLYKPSQKPSPNLWDIRSIYWYPTVGLMEATAMNVGRGTDTPFQVFGHPAIRTDFSYVPSKIIAGAKPRYWKQLCYGWNLTGSTQEVLKKIDRKLQIKYIIEAYKLYPDKKHFFQGFSCSAGSDELQRQIMAGMSESMIRKSWEMPLKEFNEIRKKYLLYPDFDSTNVASPEN